MKVLDQALEILPASPVRIADAMKTAADTVAEQGNTFVVEVTACAESLQTDMQTVADQMAAIPALLDPQPILDCCTGVLETAASDLRQVATDAAAIPQRLLEQVAGVQNVIDAARDAVETMSTLLPELIELVPDFSAQTAFFTNLPARGQALVDLAMRSGAMVEQYGRDLLPLSSQLQELATLQDGVVEGSVMAQAVLTRAEQLQQDSLAQVQSLWDTLDGNVVDLETAMQQATDEVAQAIDGVSQLIGEKSGALLAPLQAQIELVDKVGSALGDEASACDALFDDSSAQLARLGDIVLKPLAAARAQVDAVSNQLTDAAASIDGMIDKALQPLDALETRLDVITQTLRDVVAVIQGEVANVVQLLSELDDEAEIAKSALRALPDNFVPVRTMIADAIAMLVSIKNSIPPFVSQANGALDAAANELDQANALCINAIEICTRYMMKAPPLMLARTLFMGIMSAIPGVKATIASAREAVRAAGTAASNLMDQAIALVDAINPLLDQAIAQLQVAIDALLALLEQMQAAMTQVAEAAESIPPLLLEQVENACAAAHLVFDKVRDAANQCIEQLQCEALVQRLKQELSDLLDRTFEPLKAQIAAAGAPLQEVLKTAKEEIGQAALLAQNGLQTLSGTITTVRDQADASVQQLRDIVEAAQEQLQSASGAAQQQVRQAADQALLYVTQAKQAISSLNIRAASEQIAPFAQFHDNVAATFAQVQADVQRAGDVAASVSNWQTEAQQLASGLLDQVTQTASQATQSLAEIQTASDKASADTQKQGDSMLNSESVVAQVQASFTGMQQDAQGVADASSGALDQMSGALAEARAESETVTASYAGTGEPALAEVEANAEKATQLAKEAKEAKQVLALKIIATEQNVGVVAQDAFVQATAMKDEAQAAINQAVVQAETVQAQVNVARSDAIKAEAIVDAEVIKHGGTSSNADADAAADASASSAATTADADSTAGDSAMGGAGTATRAKDANVSADGAADKATDANGVDSGVATQDEKAVTSDASEADAAAASDGAAAPGADRAKGANVSADGAAGKATNANEADSTVAAQDVKSVTSDADVSEANTAVASDGTVASGADVAAPDTSASAADQQAPQAGQAGEEQNYAVDAPARRGSRVSSSVKVAVPRNDEDGAPAGKAGIDMPEAAGQTANGQDENAASQNESAMAAFSSRPAPAGGRGKGNASLRDFPADADGRPEFDANAALVSGAEPITASEQNIDVVPQDAAAEQTGMLMGATSAGAGGDSVAASNAIDDKKKGALSKLSKCRRATI